MTHYFTQPASHVAERIHRIMEKGDVMGYYNYFLEIRDAIQIEWDIEWSTTRNISEIAILLMAEYEARRENKKPYNAHTDDALKKWLSLTPVFSEKMIDFFQRYQGYGGRAFDLLAQIEIEKYPAHATLALVVGFRNDCESWTRGHAFLLIYWLLLLREDDREHAHKLMSNIVKLWEMPEKEVMVERIWNEYLTLKSMQESMGLSREGLCQLTLHDGRVKEECSLYM